MPSSQITSVCPIVGMGVGGTQDGLVLISRAGLRVVFLGLLMNLSLRREPGPFPPCIIHQGATRLMGHWLGPWRRTLTSVLYGYKLGDIYHPFQRCEFSRGRAVGFLLELWGWWNQKPSSMVASGINKVDHLWVTFISIIYEDSLVFVEVTPWSYHSLFLVLGMVFVELRKPVRTNMVIRELL